MSVRPNFSVQAMQEGVSSAAIAEGVIGPACLILGR